jgi:hypothetical protein
MLNSYHGKEERLGSGEPEENTENKQRAIKRR